MNIINTYFTNAGCRCIADLYLPEAVTLPPVIVMAHGFAGERKARLPAFAERFCQAGYAVFLFDYRGFGDSEGSPRQLVSPWRQLSDWRAAISHVRALEQVDSDRIMLWGTSFSGGHVVSLASQDSKLHAIIAQIPFTSGINLAMRNSLKEVLHMSWAGIKDVARALFGAKPFPYPVVSPPDQPGFMNTPESYEGYLRLLDKDSQWVNAVPARINLQVPFYNPIFKADKVQCPALILAGSDDSLIPDEMVKSMADRIPNGQYCQMKCNHFEPYVEPLFEQNIAIQLLFLQQHAPVSKKSDHLHKELAE